jgi:hypothetical protein
MVRPHVPRSQGHRKGGVLLEFAIVALVFYVLFAAVIDMGRASFMASAANDAARVMARELALAPLPATTTFEIALQSPIVRGEPSNGYAGIYDAKYLAIDLAGIPAGTSLDEYFGTLPIVNRALRPLMIYDTVEVEGVSRNFFRYPGALVRRDNTTGTDQEFTVVIPELDYGGNGETIVRWLPVVEEIRAAAPGPVASNQSPFSTLSPEGGIAAIRVNVPFQSTASAGRAIDPNDVDSLYEGGFGDAVFASSTVDAATNLQDVVPGGILVTGSGSTSESGAYAGRYGLGQLQLLGTQVRPFRKILSAQSIFRREVFTATP